MVICGIDELTGMDHPMICGIDAIPETEIMNLYISGKGYFTSYDNIRQTVVLYLKITECRICSRDMFQGGPGTFPPSD